MKSPIIPIIICALALVTATALAQSTNAPPKKPVVAGKEYTHPIRYEIWAPKEVKKSTNEFFKVRIITDPLFKPAFVRLVNR